MADLTSKINRITTGVSDQAALIEQIKAALEGKAAGGGSGGGGVASGSITPSADAGTYAVQHGLGKVPDFFALYGLANSSSVTGGIHYAIGYKEKHVFGLAGGSGSTGILGHFVSDIDFTKVSASWADSYALLSANEESITVAGTYSGAKLKSGITYQWVAF